MTPEQGKRCDCKTSLTYAVPQLIQCESRPRTRKSLVARARDPACFFLLARCGCSWRCVDPGAQAHAHAPGPARVCTSIVREKKEGKYSVRTNARSRWMDRSYAIKTRSYARAGRVRVVHASVSRFLTWHAVGCLTHRFGLDSGLI
jgi:hypothetical protein